MTRVDDLSRLPSYAEGTTHYPDSTLVAVVDGSALPRAASLLASGMTVPGGGH
jgi:hypothetical protein